MPIKVVLLGIPPINFWDFGHCQIGRDIIELTFLEGDAGSDVRDDGLDICRWVFDGIFYLEVVFVGANDDIGGVGLRIGSSGERKV